MFSLALFHQHYKVAYLPRGLTSWIFYAVCLLAVLVLPFIIGLAMQNFWIENNYFYQMPEVYFSNRCALRARTVLGKELVWTCNEGFNAQFLYGTNVGVMPSFSVYEDDREGSGRYSSFTFTLNVPIGDVNASIYAEGGIPAAAVAGKRDAIESVTFLPEFVYRINHYIVKLNMTAAPLLHYTREVPANMTELLLPAAAAEGEESAAPTSASGGPLCALTEADLVYHSTAPLINSPYVHYTHTYTESPLEEYLRQPVDLLQLENFARYYTRRNQSVVPRIYSQVDGSLSLLSRPPSFAGLGLAEQVATTTVERGLWEDLDALNSFTWKIYLRVPKAQVMYVPSYAEVLKWGWIQYFVIAYLLQWFLWWVRGLIVTLGLIDTKAIYSTRSTR